MTQPEELREEWKYVPNLNERYMVSSEGRVKGMVDKNGRNIPNGRLLAPHINAGYLRFSVSIGDGSRHAVSLARSVLLAFIGECPNGYECSHLNGNRMDCRVKNLTWENHTNNMKHAIEQHQMPCGESNANCVLPDSKVEQLRKRRTMGNISYEKLGAEFGISKRQAERICKHTSRIYAAGYLPLPSAKLPERKG